MQLPDKGYLNITEVGGFYVVVDHQGPLVKVTDDELRTAAAKLEELILAESHLQEEGGARELVFPGTQSKKTAAMEHAKDRVAGLRAKMQERMAAPPPDYAREGKAIRQEGLE